MAALHATVLRSQAERRVVVAGLRRGRPPRWSFVPDGGAGFVGGSDDLYEFQRRARLEPPGR